METSLRIVLLLVALVIVAGIIWDAFLSRRRKPWKSNQKLKTNNFQREGRQVFGKEDASRAGMYEKNPFESWDTSTNSETEDFEDVILVKSKPKTKFNETASETHLQTNFDESNTHETHQQYQNEDRYQNDNREYGDREQDTPITLPKKHPQPTNKIQEPSSSVQSLVILNVMARQPGVFQGRKLLDALQEANLIYGEMDIFHRHENTDGTGNILFSVTSAVEPGTFNISKMDKFVTPGITLFFNMQRPNQAIAAFELMLRTAKQLSMRLDGEIKDQQHKFLTLVTIEKYRDRARKWGNTNFDARHIAR